MKRIDFLAWRPESNASSRCRGLAYATALRERGYRLRFRPPAPDRLFRWLDERRGLLRTPAKVLYFILILFTRFYQVLGARGADAVIVQRELYSLGPPLFERLLARVNPRIVYDFDDEIDLLPPQLAGPVRCLHDPDKFRKIAALSRHLLPCTPYLAERASGLAVPATVIPTPVDTTRYFPRDEEPRRGVPVLGWIGTSGNFFYLERIAAALAELQLRHGCQLVVISDREFRAPGLEVLNLRWRLDSEAEQLRRCDIGLMPLTENAYTRAKGGYKILVYWAAGLPVVASPVGFNIELIEDERDGLLAAGEEDWLRQLGRLIEDGGLRRRLGAAGRAKVEARYSLSICASLLADVLDAVTGSERDPKQGTER